MSNEIGFREPSGTTGLNLYAQRWATGGLVWNGADHVAFVVADWATYAFSLTGVGGGWYFADMPPAAAGSYSITIFRRAGGSPAATDSTVGGPALIEWDGSAEIPVGGARTVDQDYLGDERWTVRVNGLPVAGAVVTAYFQYQYATLGPSAPVQDTSTTDASGHWTLELPAANYTITFALPTAPQNVLDFVNVTVN